MKKGFTLVELLAVIILMSILILIAYSSISYLTKQREDDILEVKLQTFYNSLEAYMDGKGSMYRERTLYTYCVPMTTVINDIKYREEDFLDMYQIADVTDHVVKVSFTNPSNFDVSVVLTADCTEGVRTDSVGILKSFGGNNDDYIKDIIEYEDGYVIVGVTDSTTGDFATVPTIEDEAASFIAKVDKSFNILSFKMYDEKGFERFERVIYKDNKFYVMAWLNDVRSIGEASPIVLGTGEIRSGVLVEYDVDFNELNSTNFEIPSTINIEKVSDGFIAVSAFKDGEITDLSSKGGTDLIAYKLNLDGTIPWSLPLGSAGNDLVEQIFVGTDNSVYLNLVVFSATGDFAGLSGLSGTSDGVVVAINNDGTLKYKKAYTNHRINSINYTNNSLYVSGYSNSTSGLFSSYSCSDYCGFVYRVDNYGFIATSQIIDGDDGVFVNYVIANKEGTFITISSASTNGIFEGKNPGAINKRYLAKIDMEDNFELTELDNNFYYSYLTTDNKGLLVIQYCVQISPDNIVFNRPAFKNIPMTKTTFINESIEEVKIYNFENENIILFNSTDNTDDFTTFPLNGATDSVLMRINW